MAVFRVQRTRDYTVMSNYHLRDQNLTLKAKGLLSMMLSLPDEWNYTTRGLAAICKEGVDAIGSALKELENNGYIHPCGRVRSAEGVSPHRELSPRSDMAALPQQGAAPLAPLTRLSLHTHKNSTPAVGVCTIFAGLVILSGR